MRVVVTIPAYNEEKTIGSVLTDIKRVMKQSRYNYRILVVDDGSKDRTAEIAKQHGAIVVSHPRNHGLAETFRTEMQHSLKLGADIIVHTDADGQYLANDIPPLIKKVEEGYDLVLGSRFLGKIESMPWNKRLGNKLGSKVISNIARMRITDAMTGLRAFTKEVAQRIKTTSNHTYTQEQIIRATQEKFRIAEVPVYFAVRKGSKSRLVKGFFEYGLKALITVLRVYRDYKPLKFFGMIGGTFFSLGLLLGIYIFITWVTRGAVGGIPRVILSGVLMLIGIQIILFGFLADMNGRNQI
jgi:glycosyltransferase involved in cell wall biosynthesis